MPSCLQPGSGTAAQPPPILVVDDDAELRTMIQWMLEDEGWRVETAGDGRQAVEQATRSRPQLVLLDMGLPVLDGDGVAAELRKLYGESLPIVVITADGHAAAKARRVGARGHLSKPFEIDELCTMVQRALQAP